MSLSNCEWPSEFEFLHFDSGPILRELDSVSCKSIHDEVYRQVNGRRTWVQKAWQILLKIISSRVFTYLWIFTLFFSVPFLVLWFFGFTEFERQWAVDQLSQLPYRKWDFSDFLAPWHLQIYSCIFVCFLAGTSFMTFLGTPSSRIREISRRYPRLDDSAKYYVQFHTKLALAVAFLVSLGWYGFLACGLEVVPKSALLGIGYAAIQALFIVAIVLMFGRRWLSSKFGSFSTWGVVLSAPLGIVAIIGLQSLQDQGNSFKLIANSDLLQIHQWIISFANPHAWFNTSISMLIQGNKTSAALMAIPVSAIIVIGIRSYFYLTNTVPFESEAETQSVERLEALLSSNPSHSNIEPKTFESEVSADEVAAAITTEESIFRRIDEVTQPPVDAWQDLTTKLVPYAEWVRLSISGRKSRIPEMPSWTKFKAGFTEFVAEQWRNHREAVEKRANEPLWYRAICRVAEAIGILILVALVLLLISSVYFIPMYWFKACFGSAASSICHQAGLLTCIAIILTSFACCLGLLGKQNTCGLYPISVGRLTATLTKLWLRNLLITSPLLVALNCTFLMYYEISGYEKLLFVARQAAFGLALVPWAIGLHFSVGEFRSHIKFHSVMYMLLLIPTAGLTVFAVLATPSLIFEDFRTNYRPEFRLLVDHFNEKAILILFALTGIAFAKFMRDYWQGRIELHGESRKHSHG